MATCCFCGSEMIWQDDHSLDAIYMEGNGVVSYYLCPTCNTIAEFVKEVTEEEENWQS